jgi:activator of 2-hydroxyglutaryl-CoA dehydratase
MADLSLQSTSPIKVGNLCTIFAEQEIVDSLAGGAPLPDLVAGIHEALASRIASLARRVKVQEEIVLTGGVAKNVGLVKALSRALGYPLTKPQEPLLTGAIGAALLGKDVVEEATKKGEKLQRKERKLKEVVVH